MPLPDKVKIGGMIFNVVDQNLAQDCKEKVLVHEITHGILEHCNLKLDEEEDFVSRFSAALYQVLKDNNLKF